MSARFFEESLEVMKEIEQEILTELFFDDDIAIEYEEQEQCVCSKNESCAECYFCGDFEDLIKDEEEERACCYEEYGIICGEVALKGYEYCSPCLHIYLGFDDDA